MRNLILLSLLIPLTIQAIPRAKVLQNAEAFATHVWHCSEENAKASCSGDWECDWEAGHDYMGLPYDWGGYYTIPQFDEALASGLGAGSHSWHGVLSCTAGLDCSGFVSQSWEAGHHATATMKKISTVIDIGQLKPADAFNMAGVHVVLWVQEGATGGPIFYEAAGTPISKVWYNTTSSWSYLNGYSPIRY